MITVPARRVKQFGVEFYQAGLSAKDIDRLVKFEVLGYSGGPRDETPKKNRSGVRSRVNWDMLEKRIAESETAYQRPVIRRKIDELVTYYKECKDAGTLPAIPGAVIITSEKRFTFTPVAGHHDLGLLQIPEEHEQVAREVHRRGDDDRAPVLPPLAGEGRPGAPTAPPADREVEARDTGDDQSHAHGSERRESLAEDHQRGHWHQRHAEAARDRVDA